MTAATANKRTPITLPDGINLDRFWSKVDRRGPDECWPWTGALNSKGYGCISFNDKRWLAHRISYGLHNDEKPGWLIIRHSCDNPKCCNPGHLVSGTHQDNSDDAISRGRTLTGERNGRVKLTKEIVAYIRENPLGIKVCDLAVLYGVSEWTISAIRREEIWKAR
jgi:hypothetical protein